MYCNSNYLVLYSLILMSKINIDYHPTVIREWQNWYNHRLQFDRNSFVNNYNVFIIILEKGDSIFEIDYQI